jgi:hypothetical protein
MLFSKHIVYEGNRGLHFNKGKLEGLLSPGAYTFWGQGHEVHQVSILTVRHTKQILPLEDLK